MIPRAARGRWTRRKLTAEEQRLWAGIVEAVTPLRSERPPGPPPAEMASAPAPNVPSPPAKKRGARARIAPPPAPAALPRRERQRLARGNTAIDARIDLHGMTQAQAHAALARFLSAAQARRAKFVLVITGKGGGDDLGRGVLRRQVPLWLALPEFRAQVSGFEPAGIGHGGEGALYVRIRRRRDL